MGWPGPWAILPGRPWVLTKRIFDGIVLTTLSLHLAWHGLVKPWGARWATQENGWKSLVGSAAVQAS